MEVETNPFVFQTDSEIVKKQLEEPNYLIEFTESVENYCVVYFSSNNIYYPNTEAIFKKDILNKNKFEWYGLRVQKAKKHIFIRDIQKQWYLNGINHEINSIEKLQVFLKQETKGYKTIMLGSSSGGYAASLLGSLLDVEYVISFNGQFQLLDLIKTSSAAVDPIVFREKENPEINKFFSIKSYITQPAKINYFYSTKSNWDIINKEHIEDVGISIISFKTSNHGIPFVKSALPYVLNTSVEKIKKWEDKIFHPLIFSFKYGGILPTLKVLYKKIRSTITT
jgi:hypothetical protein